jgi:hypothetical protein
MSERIMHLTAKSFAELEALQERAAETARAEGVTIVCLQRLTPPPNKPCLCGSGRKWKKCCAWESATQVTFYPEGQPRRRSKLNALMAAAMAAGFCGLH